MESTKKPPRGRRKNSISFQQILMPTRAGQTQKRRLHSVKQEPIWFDVQLPVLVQAAFQLMISVLVGQSLLTQQDLYDVAKFLHVFFTAHLPIEVFFKTVACLDLKHVKPLCG